MYFEPVCMHAQMARNFTLKTSKEDLKMIEQLAVVVEEDVPLYFTDRNLDYIV